MDTAVSKSMDKAAEPPDSDTRDDMALRSSALDRRVELRGARRGDFRTVAFWRL